MRTVVPTIDPVKSTAGVEGHGEGVKLDNKHYYYPRGRIPHDKVVTVRSEDFFCGRLHGDVQYLVLAFNHNAFVILEEHYGAGIKEVLEKYKNLTPPQAIELALEKERKQKADLDSMPKCRKCQRPVLNLDENQPKDVCYTCFQGD